MRKRTVHIQFWPDTQEAENFNRKVKRSGLSREAYLRHLINGLVLRDTPPPDYFSMMKELYRIGNNLNQIAQKAHILNVMDVQRYDLAVRQLDAVVKNIISAVILPQQMEQKPGTARSLLRGEKEHPRSDETFAAGGGSDKRSVM